VQVQRLIVERQLRSCPASAERDHDIALVVVVGMRL
jgi:hypothetical protein